MRLRAARADLGRVNNALASAPCLAQQVPSLQQQVAANGGQIPACSGEVPAPPGGRRPRYGTPVTPPPPSPTAAGPVSDEA